MQKPQTWRYFKAKCNNAKILIQELILRKLDFFIRWNAKTVWKWRHICRHVSFEILKIHEVAPEIFDLSKVAHVGFEFDITASCTRLPQALVQKLQRVEAVSRNNCVAFEQLFLFPHSNAVDCGKTRILVFNRVGYLLGTSDPWSFQSATPMVVLGWMTVLTKG